MMIRQHILSTVLNFVLRLPNNCFCRFFPADFAETAFIGDCPSQSSVERKCMDDTFLSITTAWDAPLNPSNRIILDLSPLAYKKSLLNSPFQTIVPNSIVRMTENKF